MNTKSLKVIASFLLFLCACSSSNQGNSNLTLSNVEFLVSNNPNSEDLYSFKANTSSTYEGDLSINIYQSETLLFSSEQFGTTIDFYRPRASAAEGEKPDKAEAIYNGKKIWEGTPQEGSRF